MWFATVPLDGTGSGDAHDNSACRPAEYTTQLPAATPPVT